MAEGLESRDGPFILDTIRVDPGLLNLSSPLGDTQLEPKVMQLLQVLAAHPGQTLAREALIDAIWGVRFGGDESLSRAVSLLRKALDVPHRLGHCIRTVPRRGYVLEAEIAQTHSTGTKSKRTAEPLIAVLPFDNLSSDPDTQFFSDGISEDIIDRLMRGTDLKLIGRTSSFQLRGERKRSAAQDLGADYVIDGSVRRAGNRVRISAHLEKAETRETLWSERYDRELTDIFAVQDDISEKIALSLDQKMEAQRQTVMPPEVYDLYLRGREWTYSTERLNEAIELLERVTQEAPDFAPAWGALARNRAMIRMYHPVQMRTELDTGVQDAIHNALALDAGNRDALNAAYQRLDHFGPMLEHHDAIFDLRRFSSNSGTGLFLVSFHETCIGRMRLAYDLAREGARLDPLNPMSASYPAVVLFYLGELESARSELEDNLDRWPDENGIRATLITLLARLNQTERLAQIADQDILNQHPLAEFSGIIDLAMILSRRDSAEMKAKAKEIADHTLTKGSADLFRVLWISQFGFTDLMYDVLEQVAIGPTGAPDDDIGTVAYRSTLLFGNELKTARGDPRFIKLCARLGLVKFWLETGVRPDFADQVDYNFDALCQSHAETPIDTFNPFGDPHG